MDSQAFLHQYVARSPDVLSQELGEETVLLDLNSESYFGLNEVGTRVWELIPEVANLEDIYKRLLAEYEIDETALLNDLRQLIDDCSDAGLITLARPTDSEHVD